ncbi:uncharacterized protein LOC128554295 isoform X2 [Mercenaria mercenaria]|uniref:uncharacterized protein LOC128554295 isoform X2 n=1 Tax=Mercenaria mercenaria TaxID=6596 RepID=UPI00234E5B60|nr:uncharacterized protein LOC128554295 isoform X2 [Mercenaria mercenaria]
MDQSKSRPDTLPVTAETELPGAGFPRGFGHLSPGTVVFHHTKVKYVPLFAQRSSADTRDQGSQADTETRIHASSNTQIECETGNTSNEENITEKECPADEYSREEIIRINLEQHLIYISHCIKSDDLILHLHCFSEGYPKIVSILDGEYNPEDQNYVKVVELFTPEIIVRLEPSELLPHLLQKGVFKQMDVEEIRAEEKNHGKMRAACVLLMYLPRRTVDWFRCFLRVLINCDLEDIAEMLDPDMFKDIKQVQTNVQSREITSIKSSNESRSAKPKVAPKPRFRWRPSKVNNNTSQTKDSLSSNAESNENAETKISEKVDDDLMKADKEEVIYSRNNKTKSPKAEEALENSDDVVIISDFSDEKLDYLTDNVAERKKIDKTMADCDAEILWPDKKRGKTQILLRSISKDKTDATTWSRKKKVWKLNVIVTFKKLFYQVAVPENRSKCALSSVSKIMCRKTTACKQHITPGRSKQLYGKRQTAEIHESPGTTKSGTCFSYANVGTALETESSCMSRNAKTASKEEPNASELESNLENRNDQTLANEMIHESEPDVFSSEEMQRYAICKMTCGRRISVMKGSLVDLRVDVMVNTTDKALSLTTGLAETISEKGGEQIRTACYKYFQTQGSIDEGEVFVSEAGSLPAKHVVHVNSPIWREGPADEQHKLLRQTVRKAMMQASVRNAQTIALPAISCGISGFPLKTATRQIVCAVRNFFREEQSSSLKHVYLVDIYQDIAKRFQEALYSEFKDDTKCVVEAVKES